MDSDKDLIQKRIALLTEYREKLVLYFNGEHDDPGVLRTYLNMNLQAAWQAVRAAGTLRTITVSPPPAVGGLIRSNLDPFQNLFVDFYGRSLIPGAIDCIEQAIGVYQHILDDSGLVRLPTTQAIDIEAAIERALRPSFRSGAPNKEADVQDALEVILKSLGVQFERDREVAPVGAKSFKPDFVVPSDELAIEAKFTRPGRPLARLQEEIAADVAAYKSKWKRILFVVYDCGQISDPYAFRKSNMTTFGVSMIVVKH